MKTWLKAGLLGGIAGIVLTIPAFLAFYLPFSIGALVSTCASVVFFLLYPGVGVLAASWLAAPRTAKQGAIDGALAGLVAFSMDSVATIVATLIIYWTGAFEQYMRQLAPQLEPEVLASANTLTLGLIVGSSCVSVLIGVLFSASGGWVFASVKPD